MKKLYIAGLLAAISLLFVYACNSATENTSDSANPVVSTPISEETAYNGADTSDNKNNFSELFSHYQHLVSALSTDNDKEAAAGAKGMLAAIAKVQTQHFTAEQDSIYQAIIVDVKEHAEHIQENVGNIVHQREHLVGLSNDLYDITKAIGSDKTIYKVYCSMYNNNKGAFWLSSTKEIKNPYFGKDMLGCGEIQEELK